MPATLPMTEAYPHLQAFMADRRRRVDDTMLRLLPDGASPAPRALFATGHSHGST